MTTGESYFTVDVQPGDGPVQVVASGELDAATAPQLAGRLAGIASLEQGVALDLGGVSFIDSSGLRVIAAERQRAQDAGGSFDVVAASEPVRRIFQMTGLGELLPS